MATYNLFLDDERIPLTAFGYKKNPVYVKEDWVVVVSYDEFVDYVTKNGLPEKVSFDHDLADEHYYQYTKSRKTGVFDYAAVKEKTGMDCVKWMVEYCMDNNKDFPMWYTHTMNDVGEVNMASYITSFQKSRS